MNFMEAVAQAQKMYPEIEYDVMPNSKWENGVPVKAGLNGLAAIGYGYVETEEVMEKATMAEVLSDDGSELPLYFLEMGTLRREGYPLQDFQVPLYKVEKVLGREVAEEFARKWDAEHMDAYWKMAAENGLAREWSPPELPTEDEILSALMMQMLTGAMAA